MTECRKEVYSTCVSRIARRRIHLQHFLLVNVALPKSTLHDISRIIVHNMQLITHTTHESRAKYAVSMHRRVDAHAASCDDCVELHVGGVETFSPTPDAPGDKPLVS